jgi:predicted permease
VSKVNVLEQIISTISTLPGVRAAALASGTPENSGGTALALEGATYATPKDQPSTRRTVISPTYFDVLRITVLRGRAFTSSDRLDATPVAIVSEDLAAKHFAGKDALGRRVRLGSDPKAPWLTIVGVVPRLSTAATEGTREMTFVPLSQSPQIGVTAFVSTLAPLSLAAPIRAALQRVDEDIALGNPRTIASQYHESNWHYRVFGALFMSFGAAALLLASAGLYGVMAFSVRRRTNEIGVRMALGADRRSILRLILLQGLWRCALGISLGLLPAWWLGNALKELLFNVNAFDPVVWGLTIAGLMAAGLLASLIPALRAAAVDPLVALRSE